VRSRPISDLNAKNPRRKLARRDHRSAAARGDFNA
jgi:hypothetical protein